MTIISRCCNAEIVKHMGKFHPDNSDFYISTSWPACSKCNDEHPETHEQCDCCGDGADYLTETKFGMWCKGCMFHYSEDLMERTS